MPFFLPPGTILEGRYEILSLLGQGGLGSVYQAKQSEIERIVAIKFLHEHELSDKESIERFRREGLALSALKHINIPQLYHFGIWQNRVPFLVMEYLPGKSLRKELSEVQEFPWQKALLIARQIADAMSHAHKLGIVHRDLKPENVILMAESEPEAVLVKVCDFGLARFTDNATKVDGKTLTKTGLLIGSAQYMSPEQCLGKKADERSDIYALSCILFEMLMGEAPFIADTAIGVIHKHIYDPMPAGKKWRSLPAALMPMVAKGMEKDPQKRFQTMSEFSAEMETLLLTEGKFTAASSAGITKPIKTAALLTALGLIVSGFAFLITKNGNKPQTVVQAESHSKFKMKALAPPLEMLEDHIHELNTSGNKIEARKLIPELIKKCKQKGENRNAASWTAHMAVSDAESGSFSLAVKEIDDALKLAMLTDSEEAVADVLCRKFNIFYSKWVDGNRESDLVAAERAEAKAYEYYAQVLNSTGQECARGLAMCWVWLGDCKRAEKILDDSIARQLAASLPKAHAGSISSKRFAGIISEVKEKDVLHVPSTLSLKNYKSFDKQWLLQCKNLQADISIINGDGQNAAVRFRELKNISAAFGTQANIFEVLQLPDVSADKWVFFLDKAKSVCLQADNKDLDVIFPYSMMIANKLIDNNKPSEAVELMQFVMGKVYSAAQLSQSGASTLSGEEITRAVLLYSANMSRCGKESLAAEVIKPWLEGHVWIQQKRRLAALAYALAHQALAGDESNIAFAYYENAYNMCAQDPKQQDLQAKALMGLAQIQISRDEELQALEKLNKCLSLAKNHDSLECGFIYQNLGLVHKRLYLKALFEKRTAAAVEFKAAQECYEKSWKIALKQCSKFPSALPQETFAQYVNLYSPPSIDATDMLKKLIISMRKAGLDDSQVATVIYSAANLTFNWQDFRTAEQMATEVLNCRGAAIIFSDHTLYSAYLFRAECLFKLGKYKEVLADVDQAIAISPEKSLHAIEVFATKFSEVHDVEDARLLFERATKIDPRNFAYWLSVGDCWDQLGQRKKRIETLKEALKALPCKTADDYDKLAWFNSIIANISLDKAVKEEARAQAQKYYSMAVEAEPRNAHWLWARSVFYHQSGAEQAAEKDAKKAAMLEPADNYSCGQLRDYFLSKHDYLHAAKAAEVLVKLNPRSFDCRLSLADVYKQKGDLNAYKSELAKISALMQELIGRRVADQKINHSLKDVPDLHIMQAQFAQVLLKQGKQAEAEAILLPLLRDVSGPGIHPSLYNALHNALEELNRFEPSAKLEEQIRQLRFDVVSTKFASKEDLVKFAFQQLLRRRPSGSEVAAYSKHIRRINDSGIRQIYVEVSRRPEFIKIMQALSVEDMCKYLYNQLFNRSPDAGGTEHWLKLFESGSPSNIEMVTSRIIYSPEFGRIMGLHTPDDVVIESAYDLEIRGNDLVIEQSYKQASELLERALALGSRNPAIYSWLGDCKLHLRDYDAAINYYNKCITLDPDFADAYAGRAALFEAQRNLAAAKSDLEKAIKLKSIDKRCAVLKKQLGL